MSDSLETFYFPKKGESCTKVFWLFLSDYKDVISDFHFTLHLAHRADSVALTAAKALIGSARDTERDRLQEAIENPGKAAKELNKYAELNSKNILTGIAEGFLWYLSNIIQEAARRRPEIVKSGESIKIEEIFNFQREKIL